jgi:hypothetical protein
VIGGDMPRGLRGAFFFDRSILCPQSGSRGSVVDIALGDILPVCIDISARAVTLVVAHI